MAANRFCVEYAKRGTAACKKCKQKIEKEVLRLGKIVPNPFTDSGGDMKQWFHLDCMFETFVRARATTKKIEDPSDLDGWEELQKEDQDKILEHIGGIAKGSSSTKKELSTKADAATSSTSKVTADLTSHAKVPQSPIDAGSISNIKQLKDNSFREFRILCAKIAEEPSYNSKTRIVADFFDKGSDGDRFMGDLYLWVKLLLPGFVKRVYNLQSKQLINHFSQIFGTDAEEMVEDLEKGDIADTIHNFFERSNKCPPSKKSVLSLQDVDAYLEELTTVTKDDDQIRVLKNIATRCTSNDLKMVIRLIKRDLRINAGAKHILEAVHPDAYQAFQTSRNLQVVIERILKSKSDVTNGKPGMSKALSIKASLLTPVLPMLAEACKSIDQAMKKCPNGMYAEIKYDGERVQLHKQGNTFNYFSRSLKPVLPHKVAHFKDYIPKAFPHGQDLILDSEVLLIDTHTGTPLPFGTLGVHKKAAFQDATVCLFVFDCIHLNGQNLMDKPLKERRRILYDNMTEVPNHVKFSEMKFITKVDDLKGMIMEVLRKGLEGLVLKDILSLYEPGKRHWLKVKKDYLAEGVMADSADLVVLGAFYGTGNKGGMMSIFLMGCYDTASQKWCTVTKVSGGHDDKTLERLQKELKMVKISKDMSKVPHWLKVTKNMVPDLVCEDPKDSQVWEIVGAEFSKAEIHTANGISIRFPRVTKIRNDKTWKEATTLAELQDLVIKSKDHENLPDLLGYSSPSKKNTSNGNDEESPIPSTSSKKTGRRSKNSTPIKGQTTLSTFLKPSSSVERTRDAQSSSTQKRKSLEPSGSSSAAKKLRFGSEEVSSCPTANLPNVFTGLKIFLSKSCPNRDMLYRYIVAYDGDVAEELHLQEATHMVIASSDEVPSGILKSTFVVVDQWLLDSVILQKVQNPKKYPIRKNYSS